MFLALSVIACKNKGRSKAVEIKLFKGFVSNSIPNTVYVISLPADYKVIEKRGPDFSVYGIRHKDSTVKSGFGASI